MKSTLKQSITVIIFSLSIAILSVVVSFVAFAGNAVKEQAEASDILSVYEKTQYDYILKNPSNEQIEELNANDSVKTVVPYYNLTATFDIANEDVEIALISIDDLQNLQYTQFAKERLIEEKDVTGNKIYIDYGLSNKYGINIGDAIGKGDFQFIVAGYYQSYNTQLAFVPNLINMISSELSYSGVYVEVENDTEFNSSVIQGYKPLATLKGRESFSDDEAYQNYLNHFNSRDYSAYITNKNAGYEDAKESYNNKKLSANSSYLIAGILSGIIILVGLVTLLVLNIKKIKYEIVDGARKSVLLRYISGAMVSVIGIIISWIICCKVVIAAQSHFISLMGVLSTGVASLLIPVVSALVALIINIIIIQGHKQKSK